MQSYPKIPSKGRTSNKKCAPVFWRNKMNWNIMAAHQIKSARTLFDMRPLIGILGYSSDPSAVSCYTL